MWKIRYLAALPGEKVKEDGMLFKTYKEAENFLREMTDDCPYKIPMYDGGKGCEACMAEWDIIEVRSILLKGEIKCGKISKSNRIMRLIRFWHRFKNQYKIHHYWASIWKIIKIAWIQSKN